MGRGDEEEQKLYEERGIKCVLQQHQRKRETIVKKTDLNEWHLFYFSFSVFLSKKDCFLRSGRLNFMLVFSISSRGNGGLLFLITVSLKFLTSVKEQNL